MPGTYFFQNGYGMHVVIIHEKDGTLNVVGPFWHRNAADEFVSSLTVESKTTIASVTDREKFEHHTAADA